MGKEETGSEFSAAPSFLATASLCSDFTGLIERATSRLEIALPPIPSNPEVDMMVGGPYSKPRRAAVPLATAMPSLAKYKKSAARAPAKAYTPFSRVDDKRLQEIPMLEDARVAYLVPGLSSWPLSKKPTLPTTDSHPSWYRSP